MTPPFVAALPPVVGSDSAPLGPGVIGLLLGVAALLGLVVAGAARRKGYGPYVLWWLFGSLAFAVAAIVVLLVPRRGPGSAPPTNVPMPPQPTAPSFEGRSSKVVLGNGVASVATVVLAFRGLTNGASCMSTDCSTMAAVFFLGIPVCSTIVLSMLVWRRAGKLPLRRCWLTSGASAAGVAAGLFVASLIWGPNAGEGFAEGAIVLMFGWPILFLVGVFTAWGMDSRRAVRIRRTTAPPRPDDARAWS